MCKLFGPFQKKRRYSQNLIQKLNNIKEQQTSLITEISIYYLVVVLLPGKSNFIFIFMDIAHPL